LDELVKMLLSYSSVELSELMITVEVLHFRRV
jgi:hypothetical protein